MTNVTKDARAAAAIRSLNSLVIRMGSRLNNGSDAAMRFNAIEHEDQRF